MCDYQHLKIIKCYYIISKKTAKEIIKLLANVR